MAILVNEYKMHVHLVHETIFEEKIINKMYMKDKELHIMTNKNKLS